MLRGDHEQTVIAHLEAAYPQEGVLVLLRRPDRGPAFPGADVVLLACRNGAGDPVRAYAVHPDDYALMAPRLGAGYVLDTIIHSHPDGPAVLSDGDKLQALNTGAVYVVASVPAGKVDTLAAFRLLPTGQDAALVWTEVWRTDVAAERVVREGQDAAARARALVEAAGAEGAA